MSKSKENKFAVCPELSEGFNWTYPSPPCNWVSAENRKATYSISFNIEPESTQAWTCIEIVRKLDADKDEYHYTFKKQIFEGNSQTMTFITEQELPLKLDDKIGLVIYYD